jgi:hypothetical protein
MKNLPEEIIEKILLYAISTPSAECIKGVGYMEWKLLSARYLQELYLSNPSGFRNDEEAERYWNEFSAKRNAYRRFRFNID